MQRTRSRAKGRLSRNTLVTIYDLVWESEFKNLITIGKLRLKVNGRAAPVGMPLRKRGAMPRSHPAT